MSSIMTCIVFLFCFLSFSNVSLGIDDEETRHDLEDEIHELKNMVNQHGTLMETLESELKETNAKIAKLDTKMLKRRQSSGYEVAFHVQLTKDIPRLGNHQPIDFDLVKTNIGDGYNVVDGIFTTPVSGTYAFAWVTTNKDRSFMNTELVVNANVYGKAMADAMDHNDYAAATNFVIVTLTEADEVWIRSGTWHNGHIAGDLYSTFSGWLLY